MDWSKLYNDEVLFNEYAPRDYIAILKFRALFYKFERDPKDSELKHFLTAKQIEFVRKTCAKDTENILNLLEENKRKKEKDKKRKAPRQQKNEIFQSDSETIPNGFPIIEREVIDKSITEVEREEEEKNNTKKGNYFSYYSSKPIDPIWKCEVEKVFKYAFYYWVDNRKGARTEAYREYQNILNSNLNDFTFVERFEKCYHAYQESDSYPDYAMKFTKWLLEWDNWLDHHDYHLREDRRLKETGSLWLKIRDIIARETGEQNESESEGLPKWKLEQQFGTAGKM
jgi:hypothetical protein